MLKHQDATHASPAQCLVNAFKGVRAAGRRIQRSPSCVCAMLRSGRVPHKVQVTALQIAKEEGLDLTAEDLILGRAASPG